MVVHDEAKVCVNGHGDKDAALQHPLPLLRQDIQNTFCQPDIFCCYISTCNLLHKCHANTISSQNPTLHQFPHQPHQLSTAGILQLQVLLHKYLVDFIQDNIHAITTHQSQVPVALLSLGRFGKDKSKETQADFLMLGGPLHT